MKIVLHRATQLADEKQLWQSAGRLFGNAITGLGDDQRAWGRFLRQLRGLEQGECIEVQVKKPRSPQFHRRHMAIEQTVFQAQERIASFEQFRLWLKVGSGFVDWMAGPKGGVVPVPKSIAYSELEEGDFRQFHDDCMAFLRSRHACSYLWPKAPVDQCMTVMDDILGGFNEA